MKIDRVAITHVRVPLREPFRISSGAVSEKDAIVVSIHSGERTGYGESSPMAGAFYSADTPEQSWAELCDTVIPAVIGREFDDPADWNAALDRLNAGNFTKTGVETALWDLAAQREGVALHHKLGATRDSIESGLAVGLYDSVTETLRAIDQYLNDGYRRVKLKIEPGRDVELVRSVRRAFGEIPLFVDANGAYAIKHLDIFRALDDFDLMMFEQPFPGPALEELAELQAAVRTPICLDESLETPDLLTRAISLGSLRIANFKLQRIGGLHKALLMTQICRERSIRAWVGTMPELGIGQAQGAALAALADFVFSTDVEASRRWFCDDIIEPMIEVRNGMIHLPRSPGLGYNVNQRKLDQYAIARREFPGD